MRFILLILISLMIFSCGKNYKYKITGINENHPVIAYVDSISGYNKDSIWYSNSDGSKVIITNYKID